MSRCVLSLSAGLLLMASTAFAEDNRSLGVAVSPVGAFVSFFPRDAAPAGLSSVSAGYAATVDWSLHNDGSIWIIGGHLAANPLETEATPLSLRVTPLPRARVRPYVGLGMSLLLPLMPTPSTPAGDSGLRLGLEGCAGVDVLLARGWFLSAQGRYQSFSISESPLDTQRQQLTSAYLGVGVRL